LEVVLQDITVRYSITGELTLRAEGSSAAIEAALELLLAAARSDEERVTVEVAPERQS
jgi:hypothetical protein